MGSPDLTSKPAKVKPPFSSKSAKQRRCKPSIKIPWLPTTSMLPQNPNGATWVLLTTNGCSPSHTDNSSAMRTRNTGKKPSQAPNSLNNTSPSTTMLLVNMILTN